MRNWRNAFRDPAAPTVLGVTSRAECGEVTGRQQVVRHHCDSCVASDRKNGVVPQRQFPGLTGYALVTRGGERIMGEANLTSRRRFRPVESALCKSPAVVPKTSALRVGPPVSGANSPAANRPAHPNALGLRCGGRATCEGHFCRSRAAIEVTYVTVTASNPRTTNTLLCAPASA
ncbi:MAG: hypothetical protein K0S86_4575 [Geminicoccaceae bacterium]|nr:hypothetical protein [Geminicoccaceae bacterium]